MSFNENLQELRKKQGMTQDDLADRLNVTRQTIYKWETGATYPDIDKVADMAKLFNVSIDQLMNDTIAEASVTKSEILKRVNKFGRTIGLSVLLILIGVATLIFTSVFNNDPIMIMGLVIMLALIFIAVLWIVFESISFEHFKKLYDPKIEFSLKEKEADYSRFQRGLIVGLALIFVGIIIMIGGNITNDETIVVYGVCVMLLLIGIGVAIIVKTGVNHSMFDVKDSVLIPDSARQRSKLDCIYGVIMLTATIVCLLWGFLGDSWKNVWICFAVGGILCAIASVVIEAIKKNQQKEDNK